MELEGDLLACEAVQVWWTCEYFCFFLSAYLLNSCFLHSSTCLCVVADVSGMQVLRCKKRDNLKKKTSNEIWASRHFCHKYIYAGCQTGPCRDVNKYKRLVWFQCKHSLAWALTKDLSHWSLHKLSHLSALRLVSNARCLRDAFVNGAFIHCQPLRSVPTAASVNPLQSLCWLVRGRMWLPRVLWEVNVHGLHSRIRGWMTEEAPQGERLFPAISLSLFLTTRLPQQMALALTRRRCEATRSRAKLPEHAAQLNSIIPEMANVCAVLEK